MSCCSKVRCAHVARPIDREHTLPSKRAGHRALTELRTRDLGRSMRILDHAGHYRYRAVRGALGDLVLKERLQVPGCAVLGNAVCGKSFFALVGRGLVRLAF